MKKLNKNQIRLIRIIVCALAFLVIFVVGKTTDIIWYAELAVYMAIYLAIGYDVL